MIYIRLELLKIKSTGEYLKSQKLLPTILFAIEKLTPHININRIIVWIITEKQLCVCDTCGQGYPNRVGKMYFRMIQNEFCKIVFSIIMVFYFMIYSLFNEITIHSLWFYLSYTFSRCTNLHLLPRMLALQELHFYDYVQNLVGTHLFNII